MQDSAQFKAQLELGRRGEKQIAELLMDLGMKVIPLYQYDKHDRAPVMFWQVETLGLVDKILPDFTCFDGIRAFFAESKLKTRWVTFNGYLETGFNQRCFADYCDIQDETRCEFFVIFKHEKQEPCGVFYAPLDVLRKHVRYWDGRYPDSGHHACSPLALFPRDVLLKFPESSCQQKQPGSSTRSCSGTQARH